MNTKFFKISWIFFILFFILGIFNMYFALVGLICMLMPLILSLSGQGKKNCSHLCPRGSFLTKFMDKISMSKTAPKWFFKKQTKYAILILVFAVFILSVISTHGDVEKIAFIIFRMIVLTSIIAVVLGVIYKPRTWCAVCPMGHLSGEITNYKNKKKSGKL